MIRKANIDDLDNLVELHLNNFDEKELSVILGKSFVRIFYETILTNKFTNINVVVIDNKIVAFSTIFFKYSLFEKIFKKKIIFIFLKFLFINFYKIKKINLIYKTVTTKNFHKFIHQETYDYHIGTFLLDKTYSEIPIVAIEFIKAYSENIKLMNEHSSTYWASCRISNHKSLRLLKNKGMGFIIEMNSFPENILITIKEG